MKARRSLRKIQARHERQKKALAIEDSAATPVIKKLIRIRRKSKKSKKEDERLNQLIKEFEKTRNCLEEILGQRVDDLGQVLSEAADASRAASAASDVGAETTLPSGGSAGPRYPTRPASKALAQALAHARPKAAPMSVESEEHEPGYFVRTLLQEFIHEEPDPSHEEPDLLPDDECDDKEASSDGSVADDEGGAFDAASIYPDIEDLED